MIEQIADKVDVTQSYLVDYWANTLGVSPERLIQSVGLVGNDSKRIRRFLSDGHRIAITDSTGVGRQVVRITLQRDGFGVHVPYHPAREGWIWELPLDYSQREFIVPLSEGKHYIVSDLVKLSFHMDGFVQFSRGGGSPIVSGYNPSLNLIKGAGLKAPEPVEVTSGPLFGVLLYGIEAFHQVATKPVELFDSEDFWYRIGETTDNDTAYNIEVFMLPKSLLGSSKVVRGKQIVSLRLPYQSDIWFKHDLRVLEFPHFPFFLGVIVSRAPFSNEMQSGYKIMGPGCGGPGETKKTIMAQFPRPDFIADADPTSLDYRPETSDIRAFRLCK